jgi:hypothetical protein
MYIFEFAGITIDVLKYSTLLDKTAALEIILLFADGAAPSLSKCKEHVCVVFVVLQILINLIIE